MSDAARAPYPTYGSVSLVVLVRREQRRIRHTANVGCGASALSDLRFAISRRPDKTRIASHQAHCQCRMRRERLIRPTVRYLW
ncbi:hypothetical protein HMPREF9350_00581 [Escherichia coli MS 85-1]|uniref:Uncharacterized protein n=1 Tax=Escherichia coli MS 85-1 TaxID=679202 RepID=A0AAN3MDH0_ECOLX|nr:hypothetical protein HMPREF9350_00581 [Escherichia coli MS 85-1]